jgi:hypothetical protein
MRLASRKMRELIPERWNMEAQLALVPARLKASRGKGAFMTQRAYG